MEIKDIKANQGNVDVVGVLSSKDEPRTFEKFGKEGRVCNAKMKDESGEVTLTLWNDEIDQVNVGDKIHIQNGWCSEYRDERQVSAGKFGKIVIVEAAGATVMTNDPNILAQQQGLAPANEMEMPDEGSEELVTDEEFVE